MRHPDKPVTHDDVATALARFVENGGAVTSLRNGPDYKLKQSFQPYKGNAKPGNSKPDRSNRDYHKREV